MASLKSLKQKKFVVAIIGASLGGILLAKKLQKISYLKIILIDRRNFYEDSA